MTPSQKLPSDATVAGSLARHLLNGLIQGGTTESALARACGVNQSTISRLAGGRSRNPNYALRRSLEAHGIPMGAWEEPWDAPNVC